MANIFRVAERSLITEVMHELTDLYNDCSRIRRYLPTGFQKMTSEEEGIESAVFSMLRTLQSMNDKVGTLMIEEKNNSSSQVKPQAPVQSQPQPDDPDMVDGFKKIRF